MRKIRIELIDEPESPIRASIDEDSIRELAFSMQKLGQLQPIGVKKKGSRYEVVFGHRRLLAARMLGWREIRAEILDEEDLHKGGASAEVAKLVENTQRENLTPVEEAYALNELRETLKIDSVAELCRITGKSATWIRQRIEILEFPEEIQAALHSGAISYGVARELSRIKDQEMRQNYLAAAIQSGCTAAMAEVWVNAALLALEGIARSKDLEQVKQELTEQEDRGMKQMYTCFICRQPRTWQRVNLVVVCGSCQEEIIQWGGSQKSQKTTPSSRE